MGHVACAGASASDRRPVKSKHPAASDFCNGHGSFYRVYRHKSYSERAWPAPERQLYFETLGLAHSERISPASSAASAPPAQTSRMHSSKNSESALRDSFIIPWHRSEAFFCSCGEQLGFPVSTWRQDLSLSLRPPFTAPKEQRLAEGRFAWPSDLPAPNISPLQSSLPSPSSS